MQHQQGRHALTYMRKISRAVAFMKETSHSLSFLVEVSFGTVLDTFLATDHKIHKES